MTEYWRGVCAKYGWAACPLHFNSFGEFVKDDPVAAMEREPATQSLSVGVPHPQYGVMRLTVCVTNATSLTRLASIAQGIAPHEFVVQDLPHLYVADRELRDVVHGADSVVLGVLVFRGSGDDVQTAPMALVEWRGMWLPYFEDANDWVMTGWDRRGRVTEVFKPFGWGCPVLRREHLESQGSCESRRSRVEGTAHGSSDSM